MKKILLCTALLSFQTLFAQNENFELVQDVYKQWHKFAFNDRNQCKTIYINDSLSDVLINCIKETFSEHKKFYRVESNSMKLDSIEFDNKEANYISEQGNILNTTHWSENIFPNAKIIHPSQFEQHFKSFAFLELMDKLCYNVYTFSNPIFLRNHTVCLFYNEERTFSSFNDGEFNLYVLKNKKWELFTTICRVREVKYADEKKQP